MKNLVRSLENLIGKNLPLFFLSLLGLLVELPCLKNKLKIMNDQPQVDNPPGVGLGLPGEKVKNPFLLDSKQPGPETGSTPVNLKNFAEQQTTANDPLIQTLMQEIKEKKPVV